MKPNDQTDWESRRQLIAYVCETCDTCPEREECREELEEYIEPLGLPGAEKGKGNDNGQDHV